VSNLYHPIWTSNSKWMKHTSIAQAQSKHYGAWESHSTYVYAILYMHLRDDFNYLNFAFIDDRPCDFWEWRSDSLDIIEWAIECFKTITLMTQKRKTLNAICHTLSFSKRLSVPMRCPWWPLIILTQIVENVKY
jgi:hypothetical protein